MRVRRLVAALLVAAGLVAVEAEPGGDDEPLPLVEIPHRLEGAGGGGLEIPEPQRVV